MAITATQVNELRQITGAGMMDCKKALTEANGDMEAAIDLLRKKGQKVAANRADRSTSEGVVFAEINDEGTLGIMLSLECETDFVARNEDFLTLGSEIAAVAFEKGAKDKQAVLALPLRKLTVQDVLTEYIGKIGEKIEIGSFVTLAAETVVPYIHNGSKLGVLVGLNSAGSEEIESAGKDVGMQIAAMNPIAVDEKGIDPAVVQREMEIGRDKARQEGKAENILDKIAEGYVKKFYKDNTLLAQAFVKSPDLTVQAYLNSVKPGLTVTAFHRVSVS